MKAAELIDYATYRLLELIETEGTNWRQPWCGSGPAINFFSKRPYRSTNQFLLSIIPEPDKRYATYRAWAEAGHQVKKGSKGYPVFFFKPVTHKDRDTDEDKQGIVLRTYTVFAASQLTNPIPTETVQRSEIEIHQESERIVKATLADIRYGGDKAFYTPKGDYIQLPQRKQFDSMPAFESTRFHEIAHWSGAPHRLARDLSGRFGSEAYAIDEIVAEGAAAMLCTAIGVVPTPRKESARYINSWLRVLNGDHKGAAMTIFSQAQKAADFILRFSQPQPDPEPSRPNDATLAPASAEPAL